jgi:hypothetical protein
LQSIRLLSQTNKAVPVSTRLAESHIRPVGRQARADENRAPDSSGSEPARDHVMALDELRLNGAEPRQSRASDKAALEDFLSSGEAQRERLAPPISMITRLLKQSGSQAMKTWHDCRAFAPGAE